MCIPTLFKNIATISMFFELLMLFTVTSNNEGDTPPFWYAVFRGDLDSMQYAKGRYAVRRNFVISYADINFYFKKVQFS